MLTAQSMDALGLTQATCVGPTLSCTSHKACVCRCKVCCINTSICIDVAALKRFAGKALLCWSCLVLGRAGGRLEQSENGLAGKGACAVSNAGWTMLEPPRGTFALMPWVGASHSMGLLYRRCRSKQGTPQMVKTYLHLPGGKHH